jgi:hypothetical protein
MELPQTVLKKYTTKKFNGLYKYKVVIALKQADWFRKNSLYKLDKKIHLSETKDKQFCLNLLECLKTLENYKLRVENPWITFYTNSYIDAEQFATVTIDKIYYIQVPFPGTEHLLDQGKILTKNIHYKYRITVGKTTQDYPDLVKWIENVGGKINSSAKYDLLRPRGHYGGTYFYLKDDKCITIARLMLGNAIRKIEEVVVI